MVDDLLVWFSASHAGYLDLEFGVLFYSPYVEVGEAAFGAVPGDGEGFQVSLCFLAWMIGIVVVCGWLFISVGRVIVSFLYNNRRNGVQKHSYE